MGDWKSRQGQVVLRSLDYCKGGNKLLKDLKHLPTWFAYAYIMIFEKKIET